MRIVVASVIADTRASLRLAVELRRHAEGASASGQSAMSRFASCVRALLQTAADPLMVRSRYLRSQAGASTAHLCAQATAAQRATSALQALELACDAGGAMVLGDAPRARLAETRSVAEPKDEEQDLEPDEYDASSDDDADDTAYCMQPAA